VADYRPETCAYCTADTWCEIRANGKPQCRACKVERFFSQVLYPPLGYTLMGWQRKVLRDIYGTVSPQDGRRRYRSGYISVAKKNGKSFLIGGLPIYHLLMENERNPQAYGAAAAKDQAGIVFNAAAQLVNANPDLKARLKVLPSTKRILRRDQGGFYAVLSADGDVQDGIEPSLAIRDEVHRWKTLRAETLHDVITKGQISREEPLDIGITTASAEYESQMWWWEYQYAKQVLDGSLRSDSFYAAIWEADSKRIDSDPKYWKSRKARVAANPSHEDLGGFLKDSAIVRELEKALAEPSERSKYLRYHLNVPLKAQEDPVIDMSKWQLCGGGVDLRAWRNYDIDRLIETWALRGRSCWAGVDASWTTDLTAVVFVFPPFDWQRDLDAAAVLLDATAKGSAVAARLPRAV
jgi:phage terminase large subunit-like protein